MPRTIGWSGRLVTRPSKPGHPTPARGRLADRIDHERIAARAYQIYESQHRADGHADDHWRQAEAEYAVRRAHELAELREHGAMPGRFVKPS